MTANEIANRLVELCRKGNFKKAQKDLLSNYAVSIEPNATSDFDKETKGLNAIFEKGKKFSAMVDETHDFTVSDPLIASNSFACIMTLDNYNERTESYGYERTLCLRRKRWEDSFGTFFYVGTK